MEKEEAEGAKEWPKNDGIDSGRTEVEFAREKLEEARFDVTVEAKDCMVTVVRN